MQLVGWRLVSRHVALVPELSAFVLCMGLVLPTPAMAGCNSGDTNNGAVLSNAACQADASGGSATAVGSGARATVNNAAAFGNAAWALGVNSTAVGTDSGTTSGDANEGQTSIGKSAR